MFSLILSAALTFDPGSNHAIVGAYAVEPKTGEVLINVNCEQSMIPASSLKVVTIAAALEILGPEHRFKTDLEIDGVIEFCEVERHIVGTTPSTHGFCNDVCQGVFPGVRIYDLYEVDGPIPPARNHFPLVN